ncbi:glycosyltransferase family 2 protein [Rubellicoccus peritrichatus]|uniref:Glycosyltransferase n=1 Tax=Rubellicoccus peritrichatus TaxID=3080537 RepID=A0AAQ3QVU2_9BACT|nr:glycosyltransferase [Puniceicoccus sp. CR14]WOO41988.1 glycosyltransferase [Puniceicoccus sp. CR14]
MDTLCVSSHVAPKFSVVIPTYNRSEFIMDSIESVLAQSFDNLELIVVDDGSSDNTLNKLEALKDPRLQIIQQGNQGAAAARNRGIERASAPWIAFLDSDDQWISKKLEVTQNHIQAHPDISLFHTREIWMRNGKVSRQRSQHRNPDGWAYLSVLPLCCISLSTAVIRKTLFDSIGQFDISYPACEDYEFWLRATQRYETHLIPEALTIKNGGRPDQLTSSIPDLDRYRIRALIKTLEAGGMQEAWKIATRNELILKLKRYIKGARRWNNIAAAEEHEALLQKFQQA